MVSDLPVGLPIRSEDGQAALDIFYFEFNEVNFYVEDDEQENLYDMLFSRIFPHLNIYRIFPLGGKLSVLAHAKDPENSIPEKKSVYVVDGDFDEIFQKQPAPNNVFYLDRYCIENFLADEDGIVDIVIETHPRKKRSEVVDRLMIADLIDHCIKSLTPLFRLFFCVQKLGLGIKNCDAKPEEYSENDKLWSIDPDKLKAYQEKVAEKLEEKGKAEEFSELYFICESELSGKTHLNRLISGKFLLTQIFHYVKSKYSLGSISFDSFVYRIAKTMSLEAFENFKSEVELYLSLPSQAGTVN